MPCQQLQFIDNLCIEHYIGVFFHSTVVYYITYQYRSRLLVKEMTVPIDPKSKSSKTTALVNIYV